MRSKTKLLPMIPLMRYHLQKGKHLQHQQLLGLSLMTSLAQFVFYLQPPRPPSRVNLILLQSEKDEEVIRWINIAHLTELHPYCHQ